MGASPLRIHSKRPQQGKVSREDLNSAIEAGDWAMVGATAALLADSSASDNSLSESEVQSMYRDKGTMCSESMSTRTEELRKKEEVRADVENLVKRLVPDEVGECVISACCFLYFAIGIPLLNNQSCFSLYRLQKISIR